MGQRVAVVGAGLLGAAVAFRCAEAGARVTILESGTPGGGASGVSFAWLNAATKTDRPYFDLNLAGMRAHRDLARELGDAPWLHWGGRLELVPLARREAMEKVLRRLSEWGCPASWIGREAVLRLEPELTAATPGAGAAWFPDEGWIDPPLMIAALLSAARGFGAEIKDGVSVRGLKVAAGRVAGVVTSDGPLEADQVVICAGAGVNEVLAGEAPAVPMASTCGALAVTEPVPRWIRRVVGWPGFGVRPDGGGRLMIHARAADLALAQGQTGDAIQALLCEELLKRLPFPRGVRIERLRTTLRPIPADGLPVVGFLPGLAGCYAAVTHSGATLAPWLGAAVAAEVVGGREQRELAPYRPSRFELAEADAGGG